MGGSGGGSSGKSDWPDYMKTYHGQFLGEMDAFLNTAQVANPYTTVAPYNPDTDLAAMGTAVTNYGSALASFDTGYISNAITAISADILDELNTREIPVFEAGMSAINATQSSGFVIGEATIIARASAQIAREASALHSLAAVGVLDGRGRLLQFTLEHNRMKIAAKTDQAKDKLEIDIHEVTWELDLYTYVGNMLAAIGGGRGGSSVSKPNKTASTIGGALSGAAAGAMVGSVVPGIGTTVGAVVGAVVGGVGGYMSAT